jgi:hypothetical protein
LLADRRGVTVTEFALIAPTFFLLLLGTFDLGQMVYAKVVLNGAVQQAARDAGLEGADTTAIDEKVEQVVHPIVPNGTVSTKRESYYDYTDIGRPEKWDDNDSDGTCDNGEAYTDENGDGVWNEDVGKAGNGGADDVVLYTVTLNYTSNFPIPFMPPSWSSRSLTSTAVKKNQPFADQTAYSSAAGVCP